MDKKNTKRNRYIIKDYERGHRKKLSEREESVVKTIRMPESLALKWDKIGAEKIREMIRLHED